VTTLAMFDVDGTLTASNDVENRCWTQAAEQVCALTSINTDWSAYPHATDSGILNTLFREQHGRLPESFEVAAMQTRFLELLSTCTFAEVPGAREFLRRLRADGVPVAIASGGWRCSALLKLRGAGFDIGDLPAAFADDAESRAEILRVARRRAGGPFASVVYFGDGVWDARASREAGFRFVGIGSGAQAERLRSEGASLVIPNFLTEPV